MSIRAVRRVVTSPCVFHGDVDGWTPFLTAARTDAAAMHSSPLLHARTHAAPLLQLPAAAALQLLLLLLWRRQRRRQQCCRIVERLLLQLGSVGRLLLLQAAGLQPIKQRLKGKERKSGEYV